MDLNAPLGLDPPRKTWRGRILIGCASATAIGLCVIGALFASADPGARAPFVVAAIPPQVLEKEPRTKPPAPSDVASADAAPATAVSKEQDAARSDAALPDSARPDSARPETAPLDTATMEHGVKVVRAASPLVVARAIPDLQGPLIIDVSRALDGARHSAKPPSPGATTAVTGPRIAIFVEGMGLGDAATRAAIDSMPSGVDLAFLPYGGTVAASVASAKAKGHEILLQLPMENGQGASPGPHRLRPDEPAAAFVDDMAWLSGQFSGYAGVTNLLGGPVTANAPTMTAVLKAVGARGLFYVDDGTSTRSLAPSLASGLGVAVLKVDVVLDATSDGDRVRANLASLVDLAKRKGVAIGMASGLPEHLGTIAKFAGDLGRQGVTLVPLSALAGRGMTTATAQ